MDIPMFIFVCSYTIIRYIPAFLSSIIPPTNYIIFDVLVIYFTKHYWYYVIVHCVLIDWLIFRSTRNKLRSSITMYFTKSLDLIHLIFLTYVTYLICLSYYCLDWFKPTCSIYHSFLHSSVPLLLRIYFLHQFTVLTSLLLDLTLFD